MKLFTPAWKKDDAGKRAKAFDKMKEDRLLAIVLDPDTPSHILGEVIHRLSEGSLLRFIHEVPHSIYRTTAVSLLKKPESIASIARDPKMDWLVRRAAVEKVEDEKILEECVRRADLTDRDPKYMAISRMRTGKLIADLCLEYGLFSAGSKRLIELGEKDQLHRLLMETKDCDYMYAKNSLEQFSPDDPFLETLRHKAKSYSIRASALLRQLDTGENGLVRKTPEAMPLAVRLIQQNSTEGSLIWKLLYHAEIPESLDKAVLDYLYDLLRKNPWSWWELQFLDVCGDPAGKAFLPFYDALHTGNRPHLSDLEMERVLDVDADFALDYLKQIIDHYYSNGQLGGPGSIISCCAEAICLMHRNGRASDRIEAEFPSRKRYSIRYTYQDCDNDIRNDTDDFDVVFWEKGSDPIKRKHVSRA